jgi:hypothetical protein
MISRMNTGRLAGLFWLLSALTGGFGLLYIRSNVLVSGDAAATAANIAASEFMFRAAVVSGLLSQVFWFLLGLTLFHLFKDVNKRLATLLLASVMIFVGIAVLNTLNYFGVLLILSRPEFLNVFNNQQLDALALFLMRLANGSGQALVEIFWVPFYVSFGLLILRSGYLPRLFGILLLIAGVFFGLNILQKFLVPQFYPALFTQLATLGGAVSGISTILWLLIRGSNASQK